MTTWKEVLQGKAPAWLEEEVDIFEGQVELRKQGKIDEKVFAETRLRRGVYGQRYDNGQRYDGIETQTLNFPAGDLTKGPNTAWDAPGMVRLKLPFGGMTVEQMEVLAELADEYSDGILHVTTRQDFQLHFVHIEDTPDLMRRLAAVNITTTEACGNSVRNVTACAVSGVCHDESFDVTPYSQALAYFLMGHSDTQDFGRKFKVAFSGCEGHACALVNMHDLGFMARVKDGKRGFAVYVGGGLGTIPYNAQLLSEFTPEEEIFPLSQAIARVFARLGEKKNRNRARIKFLVAQLGIEEFRRLVEEERAILPYDERWTSYLHDIPGYQETPVRPPAPFEGEVEDEGFAEWYQTNIYQQRQPGYSVVTVNLPLGDLNSFQMFQLADIARRYSGDNIRTTVEQNIVLRWISNADLPAVYRELKAVGLAVAGAGTIVDITSCPGTDTCKLGIASSRGLAGELRRRLAVKNASLPDAIKELKIKVSGCFNSCGQHHVADIGFFGNSRRSGNYLVPHFQVVLGGQWEHNAGSYGLAVGAVPSKRIPDVLDVITQRYVDDRERGENFQAWVARLGKKEIRTIIEPYMELPNHVFEPELFTDWHDTREYSIGDIGVGECAGEVVSVFSMEITKAESQQFEAMLALDDADYLRADEKAYKAMLLAARALVRTRLLSISEDPDQIVEAFRTHIYDAKLFNDQFAHFLFARHKREAESSEQKARRVVEEAQLFIEASHTAEVRVNGVITS